MTFVSFAQNYEDVMLWRALGHIEAGFYVDVGAFSPDTDSVTRAFSERGWRGVNVEPVPRRLAELKAKRSRDINLGVVASDRTGTTRLHVVGDTGLSTVDAALAEEHRAKGWTVSSIDVPQNRLTGLLDAHVAPGHPIHFLKIDVEGHEAAVLRGLDLRRYRPWLILIETTRPNSPLEAPRVWEPLLTEAGYRGIYWDGLNRFYLAPEHEELAPAFSAPPNVFDTFVKDIGATSAMLMRQQADEFERLLAVERSRNRDLALRLRALERQMEGLADTVRKTAGETAARPRLADRPSAWESLFFHPSGRPRTMLRRLLFHGSGKPRKAFRRLVLHSSGRPRRPFRAWLTSSEYQELRGAVMIPAPPFIALQAGSSSAEARLPSPAAAHLLRRVAARRARQIT